MRYIYFVSYVTPENFSFGFAEAVRTSKITNSLDLKDIADQIKEEVGFDVCILYYNLLRIEE